MSHQKIAVVGSRTYPLPRDIWDTLTDEQKEEQEGKGETMVKAALSEIEDEVVIVSGGAKGPDTWSVEFAEDQGWETVVIRPNYNKYGNGAPFHRNTEIVDACDELIAFWDMESKGTWDSIKKAVSLEKPVLCINPYGDPMFAFTKAEYKALNGVEKLPMMTIPKGKM